MINPAAIYNGSGFELDVITGCYNLNGHLKYKRARVKTIFFDIYTQNEMLEKRRKEKINTCRMLILSLEEWLNIAGYNIAKHTARIMPKNRVFMS